VPDQALLVFTFQHTLHNCVSTFKLLITANNLILSMLFVRSKQGKEAENIHNNLWLHHICDGLLNLSHCAFRLMFLGMPRTPNGKRSVYRAISKAFTFRSKIEYIRYEHLRNALFISKDIASTIHPRNSFTHRRFQLTNSNREAIYKQHNIQSLTTFCFRVNPLVCNNIFV